ncbi:glycosyltransferase [Paenibacillus pasadenensis]|uniref:Glycosyltransferase n=1 Tax=Paenibacillus pasadenensis TaxID=217090 RepID=A0A2N5NAK9_9BACL|nr:MULTISPECIES: glycosyltransferase family 4 protein [Paenibacillus]PLT47320.1 glycosyltransferase [Paenibacillus pasadenensis]QGG57610.1 glycosyltransferase [Paenibacillus sp. B01]
MSKPRIVFVINYFYPDYASTGQILTELCLHLQHDFDITVIAQQPGYAGEKKDAKAPRYAEDRLENISILRIRLPEVDKRSKASRLRYISAYFLHAVRLLLRQRKADFVYTISQPPVLGGLIGTIGKLALRSRHIYNIQDFNPEQAQAVGFMNHPLLQRTALLLDKLNCRLADHVILVGQDMKETLVRRFGGKNVPPHSVINNWTDEQDIVPLRRDDPGVAAFLKRHGLEDKFVVMYSGNLGLYYDLENLIRIAPQFRELSDLMFVFIGEGAVKPLMEQFAREQGLTNVLFLPYQPKDQLRYSLGAADVHLVVNQKGIKGVSVPSKIYGVMAAGKAVMGVLEEGSEAHRLIRDSGCGTSTEPQRYGDAARQLMALYSLGRAGLAERGLQGRDYLERHLRRSLSLEKYRELLLSLHAGGGRGRKIPAGRAAAAGRPQAEAGAGARVLTHSNLKGGDR